MVCWRAILLASCGAGSGLTAAQETTEPELGFLEYLGSWQEDDEEWQIISDWEPPPEGEADGKRETEVEDEDE